MRERMRRSLERDPADRWRELERERDQQQRERDLRPARAQTDGEAPKERARAVEPKRAPDPRPPRAQPPVGALLRGWLQFFLVAALGFAAGVLVTVFTTLTMTNSRGEAASGPVRIAEAQPATPAKPAPAKPAPAAPAAAKPAPAKPEPAAAQPEPKAVQAEPAPVEPQPVVTEPAPEPAAAEPSPPPAVEAAPVAAAPEPVVAPRPELAAPEPAAPAPVGEADAAKVIADIQRVLAALGYSPGPADGAAGRQTLAAATEFAEYERLADANLDPAFLAALKAAQNEGRRAGQALPQLTVARRVAIIKDIQAGLVARGFPLGRPDGDAGPVTLEAAAAFAKERGLADSNLDAAYLAFVASAPVTPPLAASPDAAAPPAAAEAAVAPAAPSSGIIATAPQPPKDDPVARRVERIRAAQRLLAVMDYNVSQPDGTAGPATVAAAASFAEDRGLSDSNIDAAFLAALELASTEGHQAGLKAAAPSDPILAHVALVRRAQELLVELGYYSGRADGSFGPQTQTALDRFAEAEELSDANLDVAMVAALRAAAAAGRKAG